jgi:hypothetical protein
MSEKQTKLIIDGQTGEAQEFELSLDEIAQLNELSQKATEEQLALEAKADARASALGKLAALGLTEEEIAAL